MQDIAFQREFSVNLNSLTNHYCHSFEQLPTIKQVFHQIVKNTCLFSIFLFLSHSNFGEKFRMSIPRDKSLAKIGGLFAVLAFSLFPFSKGLFPPQGFGRSQQQRDTINFALFYVPTFLALAPDRGPLTVLIELNVLAMCLQATLECVNPSHK